MARIKELPDIKEEDLKFVFTDEKAIFRYKVCHAIAHEGMTQYRAFKEFHVAESTVSRWVKTFEREGNISCFMEKKRGPQGPSKLTDDVIREVIKAKKENLSFGGESIYKMVSESVPVSLRNLYRILKRFKEGEYGELLAEITAQTQEETFYTSYGGSFLLTYYYDGFNLPQLFRELSLSERDSKLLLYYLHGKLLGIENINQMYHLNDDGLFFANGLNERPHSYYVHQALTRLGENFDSFQEKQMSLLQQSYLLKLERISIDPHFISYFGDKKELAKQWDAIRRYLHPGYRPLYVYDLESGACFYALWIKGSYKGYRCLNEIMLKVKKGLLPGNHLREVYLDQEFYCFRDLASLVKEHGIDFTISARKSKKLDKWLSMIDGRRCGFYTSSRGKRIKVGLYEIPQKAYHPDYPYKLTLIGFSEETRRGKTSYGYLSSIPIDRYGPTQLGKLAKSRWGQENYFKEVVHQEGHNLIPSNDEHQVKGHLAMELLGHNIVQLLKKDLPKGSSLKRGELKSFKVKLFQKIAKVTKGSTRVIVEMTKQFPEQKHLHEIIRKFGRKPLKILDNKYLRFKFRD